MKTNIPEPPETSPLTAPETKRGLPIQHPKKIVLWLFLVLLAGGLLWGIASYCRGNGSSGGGAAATAARGGARTGAMVIPVVASKVQQKDVPIYLEGLGTVQALNSVTIHSRVDGQLTSVGFTEGQSVRVGDVLAKIDPAPFQAQLAQAEAKKRQDDALLANAHSDLTRYAEMLARKAASQQQYDTQKALVAQYEAAASADQAAIQSAKVQLDYTTLTSPLEGRVGIRLLDQGNIIHASDASGLVVITQLRPIAVVFTLPEQNLHDIRKQMAQGDLTVFAMDRDNGPSLGKGIVTVYDNQIDTTTGTIKLKATFPNDDQALWPGQFVNARLLLSTRKGGVVVPAAVIQRGPNGAFAFVIQKAGGPGHGNSHEAAQKQPAKEKPATGAPAAQGGSDDLTVEVRPVKVAQIEGGEALIDEGLKPGELVVEEGQYRLQAHSHVRLEKAASVTEGDEAP